jgi:hypothetical protein
VLNAASRRSEKCISCFGQSTSRKSLHTPRQRWEYSINKYRVGEKSVNVYAGLNWLRMQSDGILCECGDDPSGSIKGGEFLNQLND